MNIGKIVLATTVFGFVASSSLAMEKLRKITGDDHYTYVFLQKGSSLRYIDSSYTLLNYKHFVFFWTRWKIEKDLTENNFVFCNLSDRRKGIICGTKDKKECRHAEEFFIIRDSLARMPELYDSEGDGYRPGDDAYNYDFYNHRYVHGGE
jgi:hypothetical protein